MKTAPVELWICLDSNGDFAIGLDADSARTSYEETIGPLAECDGFRLLKLALIAPVPEPICLTGWVAPEGGEVTLTVATEVA